MAEREIVEAYLEGRIGVWGVFRRLTRRGMVAGTALAVALAMPAAASGDTSALEDVCTVACDVDRSTIERLLAQMAGQLESVASGGNVNPFAVSLARLGANNTNLEAGTTIPLNVNAGNVNLEGTMSVKPQSVFGTANVNLAGNVGQMNLNLNANLSNIGSPTNGRNVNLGNVNMDVFGNAGSVPLNFGGNIGNIESAPPQPTD